MSAVNEYAGSSRGAPGADLSPAFSNENVSRAMQQLLRFLDEGKEIRLTEIINEITYPADLKIKKEGDRYIVLDYTLSCREPEREVYSINEVMDVLGLAVEDRWGIGVDGKPYDPIRNQFYDIETTG